MIGNLRWDRFGAFKVATAGTALLAALAAGCSLSAGGLGEETSGATSNSGGTPGATSGSGAGGASGSTTGAGGGMGGADATTGSGSGATSTSTATGGTTSTIIWNSYDVAVDASNGALSVPVSAPTLGPAAKLIAYWAGALDDASTKAALTTYHNGEVNGEGVSWYVSPSSKEDYPYVGHNSVGRTAGQGPLDPLGALDLQVALKNDDSTHVFVVFEVPIGGTYKLKGVAIRQLYPIIVNTTLVVHEKRGGMVSMVGSPLTSDADQNWQQNPKPYDLGMPLATGDQIAFEIEPGVASFHDVIELAWTIEATVP